MEEEEEEGEGALMTEGRRRRNRGAVIFTETGARDEAEALMNLNPRPPGVQHKGKVEWAPGCARGWGTGRAC